MSDAYLLDTNTICALADADRAGNAAAVQRFQRTGNQAVLLPSPAVGEIEFGMWKAPDVRPDKRKELRDFIARFVQLPFDEHCVLPYALVRAEIWRTHGTPKRDKPHTHKERRPEDLIDKVTGAQLGIDEPDLYVASIALAQNLVLVTDDRNEGMVRIREAAETVHQRGEFLNRLRVENWLDPIS
ncbi:MAG: type II toxin-antitoxin system VapC family toxin [Verrucomicrobiae bacterium]|nr:type II toxin-antitoxin system VapC family toxin [Verrucomicrobiae bacterium]